jgi:hypothetical protein
VGSNPNGVPLGATSTARPAHLRNQRSPAPLYRAPGLEPTQAAPPQPDRAPSPAPCAGAARGRGAPAPPGPCLPPDQLATTTPLAGAAPWPPPRPRRAGCAQLQGLARGCSHASPLLHTQLWIASCCGSNTSHPGRMRGCGGVVRVCSNMQQAGPLGRRRSAAQRCAAPLPQGPLRVLSRRRARQAASSAAQLLAPSAPGASGSAHEMKPELRTSPAPAAPGLKRGGRRCWTANPPPLHGCFDGGPLFRPAGGRWRAGLSPCSAQHPRALNPLSVQRFDRYTPTHITYKRAQGSSRAAQLSARRAPARGAWACSGSAPQPWGLGLQRLRPAALAPAAPGRRIELPMHALGQCTMYSCY